METVHSVSLSLPRRDYTQSWVQLISGFERDDVAIVVGKDVLKNSFADAVEQRPPSGEDLARRSEARIVQETATSVRNEEVVEVVVRCSAVDQDMDEVAVVTGVIVGDGRW